MTSKLTPCCNRAVLAASKPLPLLLKPTQTQVAPIIFSRRLMATIVVTGSWTFTRSASCAVSSEYETFAQELITGVRGVIELELTGAEERAVRRKADPQRERIKTFIQKWSADSSINTTTSFKQISYALRELGQFYIKNGERAVITPEVADRVLESLKEAETSLKSM